MKIFIIMSKNHIYGVCESEKVAEHHVKWLTRQGFEKTFEIFEYRLITKKENPTRFFS